MLPSNVRARSKKNGGLGSTLCHWKWQGHSALTDPQVMLTLEFIPNPGNVPRVGSWVISLSFLVPLKSSHAKLLILTKNISPVGLMKFFTTSTKCWVSEYSFRHFFFAQSNHFTKAHHSLSDAWSLGRCLWRETRESPTIVSPIDWIENRRGHSVHEQEQGQQSQPQLQFDGSSSGNNDPDFSPERFLGTF